MRQVPTVILALFLCVSSMTPAQQAESTGVAVSVFDGTWKYDLDTIQWIARGTTPGALLLHNGFYDCRTCVPPIKVKADGTDQKITGDPKHETANVRVIDDHSIEVIYKRDGKVVHTTKRSVSPDGNTSTETWTDYDQPEGNSRTGTITAKRIANGPPGTHLLNGQWHAVKLNTTPPVQTYKVSGNQVTMTSQSGASYVATLDGPGVLYKGDPPADKISVRKLGDRKLQERITANGKVVVVNTLTVLPDGKTMEIMNEPTTGPTVKILARRQ